MKKPLIVKDSIIILIISILCTLFFAACLVLSVASYLGKNDMESLILCALIFGGFTLPGLLLTVYCMPLTRRLSGGHGAFPTPKSGLLSRKGKNSLYTATTTESWPFLKTICLLFTKPSAFWMKNT